MSTLVARYPLQAIPMSAAQRGPRRLSARLQEKEELPTTANATDSKENGPAMKKRKMDYDEEDDGFMFTRVKKRKPRASTSKTITTQDAPAEAVPKAPALPSKVPLREVDENAEPVKKRRNKMSFSTPGRKTEEPVRRSKRLSAEDEEFRAASKPGNRPKEQATQGDLKRTDPLKTTEAVKLPQQQNRTPAPAPAPAPSILEVPPDDYNGTKISLPFADTPVIRRNKAMREGKTGNGERRSSLGLRGRRASSLIETGNSNALPHQEVEVSDFYKHIESEGLPEPRRMRQLLTWCAMRALGEKSTGGEFEDQSARMAARVIQEELLKDLANRSEMSDWFGREDVPALSKPLQLRPNPKNELNALKIKELEEQITRLRASRDSLDSLSQPTAMLKAEHMISDLTAKEVDRSLLSTEDAALLDAIQVSSRTTTQIQSRLNAISASIGPMMDSFADGIHKIGQYRDAADSIGARALAICAEKLSEKENQGRPKTMYDGQPSPGTRLGNVLRSLSRVER